MNLLKKIILVLLIAVPVLLAAAITFTIGWRPFIGPRVHPASNQMFEASPERYERGSYLVNGLMGCMYCHAEHDIDLPGAPPKMEGRGAGRLIASDPELGTVYSANITADQETGIGSWTDGEVARAIREGIRKDGSALFPLMPYERYRHLSDEDLAAVIVYIRTLPPVKKSVAKPEIKFPINRLVLGMPQPVAAPVHDPKFSSEADRGKHLAELASCSGCHTPIDAFGQERADLLFGGGMILKDYTGKAISSLNLTPDPSGIPYYDEAIFIKTIRSGQIGARKINPIMPWSIYQNLNDDDLKAIFAFIRTVKPVVHNIDNTEAPTMCTVCGSEHGLGKMNKKR